MKISTLAPCVPAAFAFLLSGSGCLLSDANSCDIKTDGIWMRAEVRDDGTNTRAAASFEVGDASGVQLELCEADLFTINGQVATKVPKDGRLEYTVSWASGAAPSQYDFVLDRTADGQVITAPVKLPPQFSVSSPQGGSGIARSTDFEIVWTPDNPGGVMNIRISDEPGSQCLRMSPGAPDYLDESVNVSDNGQLVIPPDSLVLDKGVNNCVSTLTMMRESEGMYPAQFEPGGTITATVVREIYFTSLP